jgi:hypothetical protein
MHWWKKKYIVPKTDRYGLRVGIDLFKLTRIVWRGYKGIEFVGDYGLTKIFFGCWTEMKTKPLMMTDSILPTNI